MALDGIAPTPTATASSNLPPTYSSSTPSVCTISGSSVILVAPGTCTLTASQAGESTWAAAAPVSRSFQVTPVVVPVTPVIPVIPVTPVAPVPQTIAFPALADVDLDAPAPALVATASSALPISYNSSTPAVCTVAGGSVTLVAPGTCTVTASQGGDATHLPATSVSRSFTVAALAQSISFPAPGDALLGTTPPVLTATATSGLPVAYTSSTPAVCVVSGGYVTLLGAGSCTLTAHQTGDGTHAPAVSVTRTFTVAAPAGPVPAPPTTASTTGTTPRTINLAGIPNGAVTALPTGVVAATPGLASASITGGVVTLTARPEFSGLIRVPVTITSGSAGSGVQVVQVDLVVLPVQPLAIVSSPTAVDRTVVSWVRSPNAQRYQVLLDGRPVCTTAGLSCAVPALLGPSAHVTVRSLGGDGTASEQRVAVARATHPVAVASVYFATSSARLTRADGVTLRRVAAVMRRQGFGRLVLVGNTDIRGSEASNLALSRRRAAATHVRLSQLLHGSGVRFTVSYRAARVPVASNATKAGMALNRRTDISLW